MLETVLFVILAVFAVVTAVLVIVQRNPVSSAIFLILTFFALAGIYLLLHAEFIAAIQVLVYAGAIMVLFLFVIMLLNLEREKRLVARNRMLKGVGILLGLVLLFQIGAIFQKVILAGTKGAFPAEKVASVGNTQLVAQLLFTDFLLPFEIASVLLLVAMVGAIMLAKREI